MKGKCSTATTTPPDFYIASLNFTDINNIFTVLKFSAHVASLLLLLHHHIFTIRGFLRCRCKDTSLLPTIDILGRSNIDIAVLERSGGLAVQDLTMYNRTTKKNVADQLDHRFLKRSKSISGRQQADMSDQDMVSAGPSQDIDSPDTGLQGINPGSRDDGQTRSDNPVELLDLASANEDVEEGSYYRKLVPELPAELNDKILKQLCYREYDLTTHSRVMKDDAAIERVLDKPTLEFFDIMYERNLNWLRQYHSRHFGREGDFLESFKRYITHRGIWLAQTKGKRWTLGADIPFDVIQGFVVFYLEDLRPSLAWRQRPGQIDLQREYAQDEKGAAELLRLAEALMSLHVSVHIKGGLPTEDVRQFLTNTAHMNLIGLGITSDKLKEWYSKVLQDGLGGKVHTPLEWRQEGVLPEYPLTVLHCKADVGHKLKESYNGLCFFNELGKLLGSPWIADLPETLGEWAFCVKT